MCCMKCGALLLQSAPLDLLMPHHHALPQPKLGPDEDEEVQVERQDVRRWTPGPPTTSVASAVILHATQKVLTSSLVLHAVSAFIPFSSH